MAQKKFVLDVKALRARARRETERAASTLSYTADRDAVVGMLNDALASELVCVLRYKRHQFMARGLSSKSIAAEFAEHAAEELSHADQLAERISQLGGEPDFDPSTLAGRSLAEYVPGTTLLDMINEDLVAERMAIEAYRQMIRYLGADDPTTRVLIEGILAAEEQHAEELQDLLDLLGRVESAPPKGTMADPIALGAGNGAS
jgi:bacterioferritin